MPADGERDYWENAAQTSNNLIDEYIWDWTVDNKACLKAVLAGLGDGPLLEIGCGVGRLTKQVAKSRKDAEVFGIDISPTMIELAKGDQYSVNDGRTIPFDDESMGGVYCVAVFQHIPPDGIYSYFAEAARVLKPGGTFRFQVVQETPHADINSSYPEGQFLYELRSHGFVVEKLEHGLALNNWTWITARC